METNPLSWTELGGPSAQTCSSYEGAMANLVRSSRPQIAALMPFRELSEVHIHLMFRLSLNIAGIRKIIS